MTDTPLFQANRGKTGPGRGLFARAEMQRENRLPATARAVTLTLAAFLAAALVFAAITPLRELVRAPGTIIPSGRSIAIEHLTGGIVVAVHVSEGATVARGQVLARLDSPDLTRQVTASRDALAQLQERLGLVLTLLSSLRNPDLSGTIPDGSDLAAPGPAGAGLAPYADARHALFLARQSIVAAQIAQAERAIATLVTARDIAADRVETQAAQVARLSQLAQKGYVSEVALAAGGDRLGELQGELANAEVTLAQAIRDREGETAKLAENALIHREALLKEAYDLEEQVRARKTELQGLQEQRAALTIRAPSDGVIQSVAFPVAGEVIAADTELFELLPSSEAPVAEIRLPPQDIGHVSVGDRVDMKLQTFDFRRFGGVSGTIRSLSPSSVEQPDGTTHFRAIVTLDSDHVGSGETTRRITTGMEVSAEIQTNSRTVMQYILKPLDASLRTALTER